jgi:hypothetical protein
MGNQIAQSGRVSRRSARLRFGASWAFNRRELVLGASAFATGLTANVAASRIAVVHSVPVIGDCHDVAKVATDEEFRNER